MSISVKSLRPERAKKFAAKYVNNGFSPAQAAIDCGFTTNRNSAYVIGHRLLKNVKTQKAVEEHLKAAKMDADEVLERLTKIARTEAEFKGSDVVKANELLGKGHKLFVDKVETTDTTANTSLLLKSIEAIAARESITPDQAATELYTRLKDEIPLESWPVQFHSLLRASQHEVVTDAGDASN